MGAELERRLDWHYLCTSALVRAWCWGNAQLVVGLRSPIKIPFPFWKDYRWEKYRSSVPLFAGLQRGGDAAVMPRHRTFRGKAPSATLVTVKCRKDDLSFS